MVDAITRYLDRNCGHEGANRHMRRAANARYRSAVFRRELKVVQTQNLEYHRSRDAGYTAPNRAST